MELELRGKAAVYLTVVLLVAATMVTGGIVAHRAVSDPRAQCVDVCVDGLRACTAPLASNQGNCAGSYDRCVTACGAGR